MMHRLTRNFFRQSARHVTVGVARQDGVEHGLAEDGLRVREGAFHLVEHDPWKATKISMNQSCCFKLDIF